MRKIIKLFESGNVLVCGLRGTGKDVLMGNVINRRCKPYVSNLDYSSGQWFTHIDFNAIDLGGNTYKDMISGDVKFYEYPYELGSDIYISDAGVYFPSQYCNELNKAYPNFPFYFALSRQVSHNNVHVNVQNLNRCWDKIREQSDIYIRCRYCYVFFGFVFQGITIYDKYESCLQRCKPCRVSLPLFPSKEQRLQFKMYIDNFENQHGKIKNRFLVYRNKSLHDTFYFEKLFKGGKKNENEKISFVSGLNRNDYH